VADSILFAQGKDSVMGTAAGYAQEMAKMAQNAEESLMK
jgi:3-deoxy-manno-octulosonate cytidylyltransferase (CMP-KDO synthetase)